MRDINKITALVEGHDELATSLLGKAFANRDKEVFELLLQKGADPNKARIATKWGLEPLFMQVASEEDSFWTECILKHGANPNQNDSPNRVYPLTIATQSHQPKNAKLLIEYGADVNSRVNDRSQVDFSWSQWQHEITYELLVHGADVNASAPLLKSMIGQMQFDLQGNSNIRIRTSAEQFGDLHYLDKILMWFDEHNLDWRNATHSDPTGKTPGVWSIPKLDATKEQSK